MNQDQDIWMRVGGSDKTEQQIASLRQLTLILYILYACAGFWAGCRPSWPSSSTYDQARRCGGTLYESHFAWHDPQLFGGKAWAVGTITAIIGIGFLFWVRSSFG